VCILGTCTGASAASSTPPWLLGALIDRMNIYTPCVRGAQWQREVEILAAECMYYGLESGCEEQLGEGGRSFTES